MPDLGTQFRVLIIGGGPAGLLTAHALKKHGIRATVFEQDAALDSRSRDWNFGIYWAQTPLNDCLSEELSKRVIEEGQVDDQPLNPNGVMPIYNGQTGEYMTALPAPNSIRLHRKNFLRLLSPDVDIRYSKKLKSIESDGTTATAHFEDGTSESGNLIIGAEGAHSKVREYLVGEENARLVDLPVVASVTMAKLPEEVALLAQKLHHRHSLAFHPDSIFTWVGVHDNFKNTKPDEVTYMIMHSWKPLTPYDPTLLKDSPSILADMKTRAKLFAEPLRTIFEAVPEGTRCWHNQLSYWIPIPWDNRNSTVTLIGDAAHPMTFHRGQGLNNAIHDVAMLAKAFVERGTTVSGTGDESAVDVYEREMIKRGTEAVIAGNQNTAATHDWEMLLESPLLKAGLSRLGGKEVEESRDGAAVKA